MSKIVLLAPYNNLSLKTKVLLLIIFSTIPLLFLGIFLSKSTDLQKENIKRVMKIVQEKNQLITGLELSITELHSGLYSNIVEYCNQMIEEKEFRDSSNKNKQELDDTKITINQLIQNDSSLSVDEKNILKTTLTLIAKYEVDIKNAEDMAIMARSMVAADTKNTYLLLKKNLKEVHELQAKIFSKEMGELDKNLSKNVQITKSITIATVILSIMFSLVFFYYLIYSIRKIAKVASDIAAGVMKLVDEREIDKSEVGDCFRSLNNMIAVLKHANEKINRLNVSRSQELKSVKEKHDKINQEINSADSGLKQMIKNTEEQNKKLNQVAGDIVIQTKEGMSIIEMMSTSITNIENSNKDLSEIMSLMRQICSKTAMIDDIVFETKILSFNASIEAAQAGEVGVGFAVVAKEVGNLAKMSGETSGAIGTILEDGQKQVEEIIANIKTQVQQAKQVGKDSAKRFSQTISNVHVLLEQVQTVKNSLVSEQRVIENHLNTMKVYS
ncbi:MAG: hypothetical protein HQK49_04875 [Oligoflexia bacterium]|nr:hypothetical protein [Oligoflexia bacterium]